MPEKTLEEFKETFKKENPDVPPETLTSSYTEKAYIPSEPQDVLDLYAKRRYVEENNSAAVRLLQKHNKLTPELANRFAPPVPELLPAEPRGISLFERLNTFIQGEPQTEAGKIAPSEIVQAEEHLKRIPPSIERPVGIEQVGRLGKGFAGGVVGTAEGMVGTAEWLSGGAIGRDLGNTLRQVGESLRPTDPNFADALASGLGSALTFAIPGFGVSTGTARLGLLVPKLASWAGVTVSSAMEAMTEAGSVYRNVRTKTGDIQKADDAAKYTFFWNMPLLLVTNKLGIFGEKGGALRRAIVSSQMEGLQETIQEKIAGKAEQRRVTFGEYVTAYGVGALTGAGIGGLAKYIDIGFKQLSKQTGQEENTLKQDIEMESGITGKPVEEILDDRLRTAVELAQKREGLRTGKEFETIPILKGKAEEEEAGQIIKPPSFKEGERLRTAKEVAMAKTPVSVIPPYQPKDLIIIKDAEGNQIGNPKRIIEISEQGIKISKAKDAQWIPFDKVESAIKVISETGKKIDLKQMPSDEVNRLVDEAMKRFEKPAIRSQFETPLLAKRKEIPFGNNELIILPNMSWAEAKRHLQGYYTEPIIIPGLGIPEALKTPITEPERFKIVDEKGNIILATTAEKRPAEPTPPPTPLIKKTIKEGEGETPKAGETFEEKAVRAWTESGSPDMPKIQTFLRQEGFNPSASSVSASMYFSKQIDPYKTLTIRISDHPDPTPIVNRYTFPFNVSLQTIKDFLGKVEIELSDYDIYGKPVKGGKVKYSQLPKAGEVPQAPAKPVAKKLTIQQDIDTLIQEGAPPEMFAESLTIFDKLKKKGVERIAITQALRDHLEPDEIKAIAKQKVGIFSKEVTANARPFDEVAATMGMSVDDLAEALRTAKTRRQALDDIKRQIEIQKESVNPPVRVGELELEQGDKFKIGGEDYKVTAKEGEVLTIKNKETFKVSPTEEIPTPDIGSIEYAGTEFPTPEQPKGAEGEDITKFLSGGTKFILGNDFASIVTQIEKAQKPGNEEEIARLTNELNELAKQKRQQMEEARMKGIDFADVMYIPTKEGEIRVNLQRFAENPLQEIDMILPLIKDDPALNRTVTHAETERLATEIGISPRSLSTLLGKVKNLNAYVVIGGRIIATHDQTLTGMLNRPDVTDAELLYKITQYAVSERNYLKSLGEIGRGLEAAKIPITEMKTHADMMTAYLEGFRKSEFSLRDLVNKLKKLPSAEARVKFLAQPNLSDAFLEAWINGLLSPLTTQAANMVGNGTAVMMALAETRIAESLPWGSTPSGMTSQKIQGLIAGMMDVFTILKKANEPISQKGESLPETTQFFSPSRELEKIGDVLKTLRGASSEMGTDKFGLRRKAFTGKTFGATGGLAKAIDLIGEYIRTPGQTLMTMDEFFKVINYRMELHAQAYATALGEGLQGKALTDRMNEIVANPPETIHLESENFAFYNTFNQELGSMGKAISAFAESHVFAKVTLPFIKISSNLMKYTFERTPLALVSQKIRADWSAGGMKRDMVEAKVAMGSMIMATAAAASIAGLITGGGPRDPELKRLWLASGKKPYSIKIGDTYYSYSRIEPIGSLFGLVANFVEIAQNTDMDTASKIAMATYLPFADVFLNKTYLLGLSGTFDAMQNPTTEGPRYVRNLFKTIMPRIGANFARVIDPQIREVHGMIDALKADTPGWSMTLPPKRDIFGNPQMYEGGYANLISPVYIATEKHDPVIDEILKQQVSLSMPANYLGGAKPPSFGQERPIHGIQLNPYQYDRLVQIISKEIKSDGHNLHDTLAVIMKTPFYQAMSEGQDGGRAKIIRAVVNSFKESGKVKFLVENPAISGTIQKKQVQRQQALVPTIQ